MKTKNVIKIFLDAFMIIVFLLLMNMRITGILFHEIAGVGIFVFIFVHNVLNGTFIINTTKNIFSKHKKVNGKVRFMYMLNLALTVGIILIIITGILISNCIFTNISTDNRQLVYIIHKVSSFAVLGLIIVHIGLHAKYIKNAVKGIAGNIKTVAVKRAVYLSFTVLFICAVVYTPVAMIFSKNENNNNKTDISEGIYSSGNETPSLDEFLNSLRCTGCHRSCSLLSPRCGVGMRQAQQAISQYSESGSSSSNSSFSNEDSQDM